ncbi:hypothetical protein QTO34_003316, partial [Cnephaeus nilssonii]
MRLHESLSTIQADNVALREKLQNLPDLLYNILTEELKDVPEEGKAAQEEEQDVQETGLFQVDRQPHGECNNPASRRQPCSPCSLMLPMTTETNVSLKSRGQRWAPPQEATPTAINFPRAERRLPCVCETLKS